MSEISDQDQEHAEVEAGNAESTPVEIQPEDLAKRLQELGQMETMEGPGGDKQREEINAEIALIREALGQMGVQGQQNVGAPGEQVIGPALNILGMGIGTIPGSSVKMLQITVELAIPLNEEAQTGIADALRPSGIVIPGPGQMPKL